jgi:putative flippase GtrA
MLVLNGYCFSILYGIVTIYIHWVSNYAYGLCGAQEDPVSCLCAFHVSWLADYVLNISCEFGWIIEDVFDLINVF